MTEERRIYNLNLHERYLTSSGHLVTRVSGGWIYRELNGGDTGVFVPMNKEFQAVRAVAKTNGE